MASLSKRDIEMIFRAETDQAQRPVNELTADIRKLRRNLDDLSKSTGKTDKSLEDLANTTRDLEKAQAELGNARSLLTQLNSQAGALERAETAAATAAKKYSDLKAQVDGTDKPTKRLTNSLDAAERKMNAANARLEEQKQAYNEVKTSIEGIIGPVDNLQQAFRTVAVAQRDITQGLTTAKNAVTEFKAEIATTAAEAEKLKALEAFRTEARASGLSDPQIAALEQEINRVELLKKAKADLAAQDRQLQATAQAAIETQNLQFLEAIQNEKALSAAKQEAAQRSQQVNAFRGIAADALAAQTAAERVAAGIASGVTPAQRLQEAIFGIVNPAQAAATSIEGIDARLEAVIARMSGGKISVNEWNHLNNELQAIQANLVKAAAEVDRFTEQQSRVDKAAAAYDVQAKKVQELAGAHARADTDVGQLTEALRREQAQLTSLGNTLDGEVTRLNSMAGALQRVGVDSRNVPAAIQRIEQTAGRAAPAIRRVSEAITPGGRRAFLGLDAFQLQNLSFQVNDVFTSLASGISPMQTLAQQGGQIVQIFPGAVSAIAGLLPILVPLAAATFAFASSIAEANRQISSLREGKGVIASLGETNGNTAETFAAIAKSLRDVGVSAEDANKTAKVFITEGLNPKAIDDYVVAAKNLADVTGQDVPAAAKELTDAFTGGADAVLELDNKYHFLTDTQRENIIASKDTKNEHNEVNKAFTALYKKMQEGANASKGPFTDAANTLRAAWRALLQTFADTGVIQSVTDFIGNAIRSLAFLINLARRVGANFAGVGSAFAKGSLLGPMGGIIAAGAKLAENTMNNEKVVSGAYQDTVNQMLQADSRLRRPQSAPGADAGAGSRGRQRQRESQAAKDRKDAAAAAKKAAREAEAEAKRRAREAEQLEKQYQNEQDQLQASLSRFIVEANKNMQAPLETQLQLAKQSVDEQFRAVEDRLKEFRDKFGGDRPINGMTQEQFARQLANQKAQILLAKQLGVYESNTNDLIKARDQALKSIKDDQAAGLLTAQQALDKTVEVTSRFGPAIDDAITAARVFIATLTPSAETTALLEKFNRIQNQMGEGKGQNTILRTQAQDGVSQNEKDINALFERRNVLVETANKLYEAGVIGATEQQNRIREAYAGTNDEIGKAIDEALAFLQVNQHLFPPEVYQNAIANLQLYNSQLKYTDELHKAIKQSAQDAISGGIVNMFNALAQGISDAITGSESFLDVLANIGRAALQFVADFAKAIAQAIIQIYALRIAKSLVGGFHGGGTVGDYGGGRMVLSRNLAPSVNLAGVPRYHNGTEGAGLKSNEMLAVLQKGEKVSTVEQQAAEKRRIAGLEKAASGGRGGLRQVLAFGDKEIAGAMAGPAGEDVVVTHIRRNAPRIRQELGL